MLRHFGIQGFKRVAALITIGCVTLLALVWGITWERIAYERSEADNDAIVKHAALVQAFQERASRVLQGVDATLKAVRHERVRHGERADLAKVMREHLLAQGGALTTLSVVDAQGRIVQSMNALANVDLSDRDYFKAHATGAADVVLVSQPVTGRISGRAAIPVSRRIDAPDGSFAGIVLAGVDPVSFAWFYDHIDIGDSGILELVGLDGIARVRRVGGVTTWGDDLRWTMLLKRAARSPSGNFTTAGKLDGVQRHLSYRVMGEYGLIAAVASSVDESLAAFHQRRRGYLAGSLIGSLLAITLSVLLLVAYRRQEIAREASRRSESRYRATFDHAPIGIAQLGLDGVCLRANREFRAIHRRSEDELRRICIDELVHPDDRNEVARLRAWAITEGETQRETEVRQLRPDGSCAWVLLTFLAVRDPAGEADYLLAMARDVTQQKEATAAARESQAQFHQLADHIPEAFWISGAGLHDIHYLSPAYDTICGRHFQSLEHAWREWKSVLHPEDRPRVLEAHAGAPDGYLDLEHRIVRPSGEVRWVRMRGFPVPDAQGGIYRVAGTIQDLTAQKAAEEKLQHQAHYDVLTDLPNRLLLHDRINQALSQARRKGWQLGVLFVDLDRFKAVNDTLGHPRGDELLREAARRMSHAVRAEDTVARVGGDEFVVLLSEMNAPQDAGKVAEKILYAMAQPFTLGDHEVYVTASTGIALFPSDGADGETLLKNADTAMFRAKEIGHGNCQFYTAEMNARAMDKLLLERDLRRALERGELLLHLQPKARLADGAIIGFEALLRWQRAGNGMVPPNQFVPLLEESGLIVQVGEWVLRAACAQLQQWRAMGLVPLPIAVNVSARQFASNDLYSVVDKALHDYGIDASLLEVEITESDAMKDPDRAIGVLQRLKERGVAVSIDDFGTGYSSLGYLKRFPVDKLKLDRSFVMGLPGDADDVSIANAVVSMAHSLGLRVVAEGVETEDQRDFLASNGCDQMQGYLLSRPLPADRCPPLLEAAPRLHAVS